MNKKVLVSLLIGISSAGTYGCTLEPPIKCSAGTHLISGESACEADSAEACGADAFNCTTAEGVSTANCSLTNNTSQCVIESCKDGYILIDGSFDEEGSSKENGIFKGYCIAESVNHCGNNNIDCILEKPARAKAVTCDTSRHKCKIESCTDVSDVLDAINVSGNWLNQCIEVSTYECIGQYCQEEAFSNGESFDCDNTRTGSECKILSCKTGYFLDGGKCVENTIQNCGRMGHDCEAEKSDGVSTVSCSVDGQCINESCTTDYELVSGECVYKAVECKSANDCITFFANQGIEGVSKASCSSSNTCTLLGCEENYRFAVTDSGYTCIKQELTNCTMTDEAFDCTTIEGFDQATSSSCNKGICTVTACKSGYHVASGTLSNGISYTTCEKDTSTNCGASHLNCDNTIDYSASTYCSGGACYVSTCATGRHPDSSKTSCVSDTTSACGQPTVNCIDEYVSSASCSNGKCSVSCKRLAHASADGTKCYPDTPEECGASRKDCTAITYSSDVSCEDGTCVVNSCKDGYGMNSTHSNCVIDKDTSCGGFADCTKIGDGTCVNGRCVYSSCSSDYTFDKANKDCCLERLHIKETTYKNDYLSCVYNVTMESNVTSITMNNLRTVTQFQTCINPIGIHDDDPDSYTIVNDHGNGNSNYYDNCENTLKVLNLPNLESAYGLYIHTNNDLKFYSFKNISWLYGSANSLFAPKLNSMGGDIDFQLSCDIDFEVSSLYTPRLKSIYIYDDCIYMYKSSYQTMDWVYPDDITGSVPTDSQCIDMALIPMPYGVCKGFQENCVNDLECSE